MVGVNAFVQQDDPPIEILYIDESTSDTQLAKLEALRKTRNNDAVHADARRAADRRARPRRILMPRILDAVRAYATVGEMCDALREVWGNTRKCRSSRAQGLGPGARLELVATAG